MNKLTHFNPAGDAHMVAIDEKVQTRRIAIAAGRITMQPETLSLIVDGGHKKGDVLGVARLAGIMAAKRTSELIPLCHPLTITHLEIDLDPKVEDDAVVCRAEVHTIGRTGVEMEALTAVHIALLTIYDMCKAVDRGMTMGGIQLVKKSGGNSGLWQRDEGK